MRVWPMKYNDVMISLVSFSNSCRLLTIRLGSRIILVSLIIFFLSYYPLSLVIFPGQAAEIFELLSGADLNKLRPGSSPVKGQSGGLCRPGGCIHKKRP